MNIEIIIDGKNYHFSIIDGQIVNIYRMENDKVINLSTQEMQKFQEFLQSMASRININIAKIYENIDNLIKTGQIKSYEELQNYYQTIGLSKEQINELNNMFIGKFNSLDLPNEVSEYQKDFEEIKKYIHKSRTESEKLHIAFKLRENSIMEVKMFELDDEKKEQTVIIDKKYNYNEQMRQELINKTVYETSVVTSDKKKEITTQKVTKPLLKADFKEWNNENVSLEIDDIEDYYANDLEQIAKNPTSLEKEEEQTKQFDNGYQRVRTINKPTNSGGYVDMKTFIGMLIFALIVVLVITNILK